MLRGPLVAALVVLVLIAATTGCNAEADLIAYFGSPSPDATSTPAVSPTSAPTLPGQPTITPTTTGDPTPTGAPPTALPSPTDGPGGTPAWSPLPTRPPGLASFAELRDSADVTDISRLVANPNALIGSTVYFEGRVSRLVDVEGGLRALVKIGDLYIFLVYNADQYWGDHPLVQGDRIRVVGEFIGMSGGDEPLPEIEPIDMQHRFA
jgi:hypothetical protein